MDFITKCGHVKDMFGKLHGVISYSGLLTWNHDDMAPLYFFVSLWLWCHPYLESLSLNALKCYELTRKYNLLPSMQAWPLTYAVYPWFMHCKCALMQKQ